MTLCSSPFLYIHILSALNYQRYKSPTYTCLECWQYLMAFQFLSVIPAPSLTRFLGSLLAQLVCHYQQVMITAHVSSRFSSY